MRVLGIDPGLSGAMAIVDTKLPALVIVADIPVTHTAHGKGKRANINLWAMRNWLLLGAPIDLAILEKVGAMPGQGVTSMFRFGQAAGLCQGLLAGLNIKLVLVPPRKWKTEMGVGREKDQARQIITDMYPTFADAFRRKKDIDRAEAALMAVYGTRMDGA